MRWLLERLRPRRGWGCVRVATRSASRVTSAFNCCTSVLETAAMIGGLPISYYFVSHVCQLAKIGSTVGGGEDHPHVGRETLEKELLEESVLFRRVT